MKKQVIIGLLGVMLLTGCSYDNSSVSGVVPVAFDLQTVAGQDYNIQACKDEYYQRVVDILDETFSETSKSYFTGSNWQVKVVDEPLGSGAGYIQSGKCDYNNKIITVYSLDLESSLKHELGHYYSYIYKTYIQDWSGVGDEEATAEAFARGSSEVTEIKEAVDSFNTVVDFFSIEEVTGNLRGINGSSDFLATSEVNVNKLIDLCKVMSDELRGSISESYYVILTTQDITTENPHYIIVNANLPVEHQIEFIKRKAIK